MADEVYVICEGECNPNLRDYDNMMARAKNGEPELLVHALTIKPVHTLHLRDHSPVTHRPKEVYVAGRGFFFVYRCTTCGHPRKF